MSADSDGAAGGGSVQGAGPDRLQTAVKYAVAALWALGGLYITFGAYRSPMFGIPLLAMALAFVRWPAVLRWPMTAYTLVAPALYVGFFLWYGHALTNHARLLFYGLYFASHVLLLFGRFTTPRAVLGGLAIHVCL